MGNGEFGNLGARALIIHIARSFVGSHYVNGSDGQTPGSANGTSGTRFLELREKTSFDELAIHAAATSKLICQGRPSAVGGYKFVKSDKEETQDGKRYKKLIEYQKTVAAMANSPNSWPSFDNTGLYPRRFKAGDTIYLGEDCRGIMHFDCVSFVTYCLIAALGKGWTQSISRFQKGGNGGNQFTVFTKPFPEKFMNADIFVRVSSDGDHIAFVSEDRRMIHAEWGPSGVVEQPYKDKNWTSMVRLNDSWIG
ncbi:MAG: hypothetical protein L6R30_04530 [Thermoanaerobaculia bacterium]|nr:hypothetical protein [Thermoanaerobaculia bacterium]